MRDSRPTEGEAGLCSPSECDDTIVRTTEEGRMWSVLGLIILGPLIYILGHCVICVYFVYCN